MRVLLGVLTLAVVACGGEHDEPWSRASATPPSAERSAAEPEIPLERRLEAEHDFVVDIDVVALRKANGLPPDADIARDPDQRVAAGSALFYLMLNNSALADVIDHRRITRVLYDGRSMAIATDQP